MSSIADTSNATLIRNMTMAQRVKAILASSSGNLVEWYDFYTYAFTAIYFAKSFFPKGNTTTELLQAAAIFAVGFLMRPIGSWYFGRLADRVGRRHSMVVSVLMMCLGSLIIAVVPTSASIGLAAPVILLLARMLQGFSVGGEYGATATYMSEVAAHNNRGFLSSFQYVTLIGGQLLASLVIVVLLQFLTPAEMSEWGWRLPFALGAVLAIVAMYLRRTLIETTDKAYTERKEAGTIGELLKHPRSLLTVIGFTAAGSLSFYTFTTYMQKYLVNTAHFSKEAATYTMTLALFIFMLVQPLFGALSDRIGRRNSMILYGVSGVLTTIPIMTSLASVKDGATALMLILAALGWVSFYTSVSGVVKAELFPKEVRALGVGLSYAIANAIFGGSAEYVALQLKDWGMESAFFWYVTVMMGVGLLSAIFMPDNRKQNHMMHD